MTFAPRHPITRETDSVLGLALLLVFKFVQAALANWTLEGQFSRWRSDPSTAHGWSTTRLSIATVLFGIVVILPLIKFARPDAIELLNTFPTDRTWRLNVGDSVQVGFDWTKTAGRGFFDGVTLAMRALLDWIETILVQTPWPVVGLVIFFWLTSVQAHALRSLPVLLLPILVCSTSGKRR